MFHDFLRGIVSLQKTCHHQRLITCIVTRHGYCYNNRDRTQNEGKLRYTVRYLRLKPVLESFEQFKDVPYSLLLEGICWKELYKPSQTDSADDSRLQTSLTEQMGSTFDLIGSTLFTVNHRCGHWLRLRTALNAATGRLEVEAATPNRTKSDEHLEHWSNRCLSRLVPPLHYHQLFHHLLPLAS